MREIEIIEDSGFYHISQEALKQIFAKKDFAKKVKKCSNRGKSDRYKRVYESVARI